MRPVVTVANVKIADHFQQPRVLLEAIFAVEVADGQRGGNHLARVIDAVLFNTSANSLLALMMFCTLAKSSSSTMPWASLIGVHESTFYSVNPPPPQ